MAASFFAKNVGNVDRGLRVVVGIAALGLVFAGPKTAWGLVGIIPLFTGLFGSCPLYSLVGLNTCPVKGTSGTPTRP